MKYEFIDLDCGTEDLVRPMEELGYLIKRKRPENVRCPKCGKRTIYTWRHCADFDIVMAVKCSHCGLNLAVTGTPTAYLKELLGKVR